MATKTPKEIAVEFGSDARTVRKFLRSEGTRVGKGNRHAVEAKGMKSLRKRFDAWVAAKAEKAPDELETPEVETNEEEVSEETETE